jgi:hypothetical protein
MSWYPPEKLSNLQRNRLRNQRSQWVLLPEREPQGTTTKPHSLGIYIRCTRVRHRRYRRLLQRRQRRSRQTLVSNRPPNAKGNRKNHPRRQRRQRKLTSASNKRHHAPSRT